MSFQPTTKPEVSKDSKTLSDKRWWNTPLKALSVVVFEDRYQRHNPHFRLRIF